MVFVLKPKPHPRFVRRGNELVHKVTLPLYQALIGASIEIKTLDDRNLKVSQLGGGVPYTVCLLAYKCMYGGYTCACASRVACLLGGSRYRPRRSCCLAALLQADVRVTP